MEGKGVLGIGGSRESRYTLSVATLGGIFPTSWACEREHAVKAGSRRGPVKCPRREIGKISLSYRVWESTSLCHRLAPSLGAHV